MDGLTQILADSRAVSPLIGILYAEDFDEPQSQPEPAEPVPDAVDPPPPALTQADLDQACVAAVAAARRDWENDAQQLRIDLLGAVSRALIDAREASEQIASATAEALATTMLAMLSGAMPQFCNQHGPAEVRALLGYLLPTLRSEPRLLVRVHPDLVPELKREFLDLHAGTGGTLTVLPATIEPGDVNIEWENGTLSRDTSQILQAMQDALGQLGLQQPQDQVLKRKLAHAE